jgi:hypothetical protein
MQEEKKEEIIERSSPIKRFTLLALTIIITFAGLYLMTMAVTMYHEHVHKAIFDSYGIPSEIEYNYLFFLSFDDETLGVTIPDSTYYEKCTDSCKLANNMNEVVGYHFNALLVVIVVVIMIFAVMQFLKSSLDPNGIKVYNLEKNYYLKNQSGIDGV